MVRVAIARERDALPASDRAALATLALPLIRLRVPGALEAVARAEHRQRRFMIVGAHLPEIAVGGDGQREVTQILPADELDQLALGVAEIVHGCRRSLPPLLRSKLGDQGARAKRADAAAAHGAASR